MATYTVQKNDCLYTIAKNQLGNASRWPEIASLNNIAGPKYTIYPNQVLQLPGSSGSSGGSSGGTTTAAAIPVVTFFTLLSDTETLFAAWSWGKTNTEKFEIKWQYNTGQNIWIQGNYTTLDVDETNNDWQSTYNIPSNATAVRFYVRAVSKTHKVNDVDTSYWPTSSWSTQKIWYTKDNPPSVPSAPSVEIEKYKLTTRLDNLSEVYKHATEIQFQVVKDDATVYNTGTAKIITYSAIYSCTVESGHRYKVRCRSKRDSQYSGWSDFSSNYTTIPAAVTSITSCYAKSETSVYLEWPAANGATSYDIEYATKLEYFDNSDAVSTQNDIEFNHFEKTGLDTGSEYFFRVRASNSVGDSVWSSIASTVIGKEPAAPTTWSMTTTAITGEPLNLYWIHNAADGSSQTFAELELTINGVVDTRTIANNRSDDEKDKTSVYAINTSLYSEGTTILWRVRTAGVTNVYGDWSIQRAIDIYAPPTLDLAMKDNDGNQISELTSFPFYVQALAGPSTQAPTGYHLTITANESYETTDSIGNFKMVNSGDAVYSKYFDTSYALAVAFSANNVDLENNVEYTISCVVSMNSGLTTEASLDFTVAWEDVSYQPNAEIGIDLETVSANIRPYCEDLNGDPVEGVTLSVYRREFNGEFTEIGSGLSSELNTYIVDPHPSLDFARYRIVAITDDTGAVSYYDTPGYPVGEKAVIIQWAEDWSEFDANPDEVLAEKPWSGSMLRLPYNIDVTDKYGTDVSLVEYIGRKRPVSYYGTQLGETSSWSMVIPKSDTDTLYSLRRLAIWMGDVYVREPSGTGYWANISVSFGLKHKEVTIPVSIDLTRVEGGI